MTHLVILLLKTCRLQRVRSLLSITTYNRISIRRNDIDALRSARRKKRHGFKKLLGIAAVMTVFCAPVGLATLGSAVASHHGGGGDISSLEAMIRKNQAFISKLNSVMKLLFRVCCYI